MENLKFCKDCKYLTQGYTRDHCIHPTSLYSTDIIYGHKMFLSPEAMREKKCGPDAKLFERNKKWFGLW